MSCYSHSIKDRKRKKMKGGPWCPQCGIKLLRGGVWFKCDRCKWTNCPPSVKKLTTKQFKLFDRNFHAEFRSSWFVRAAIFWQCVKARWSTK